MLQPCPTSAQTTLSKIQQANSDVHHFSQSQHTFLTHLLFNQSAFATSFCCFHAVISTIHSSLFSYVTTAVIVHRTEVPSNKRARSNRISGSVRHVRSVPYQTSVHALRVVQDVTLRSHVHAPPGAEVPFKVRTNSRSLVTLYFIVFYGQLWCFVSCIYIVYLTFKPPHLHLPLHQCFPPHCKIFAYRGAGALYACKNKASMSKQRRGMTF